MCDPVTAAVMMVGSAAVQYQQQNEMAKAQEKRNNAIAANAQIAYETDLDIIARRREEELDKYGQTQFDVKEDAKKKRATAIASNTSISGFSVQDVIDEVSFQEGVVTVRNQKTEKNIMAKLLDDEKLSESKMIARINNITPVVRPSFLGTALEVGSGLTTSFEFESAGDLQYRT